MVDIIYNQNWELCISLCQKSFTITYNDTQVEEDKSKKKVVLGRTLCVTTLIQSLNKIIEKKKEKGNELMKDGGY